MRRRWRDPEGRALGLFLLLPALACVLFLVVFPLFKVGELSLRMGRSMNFARISQLPLGLGNYERVLGDPAFWHAVRVTLLYAGISVAGGFVIGLATALLLNRAFPGRRWFRTLLLLPWAVPGIVSSIVFKWMFDSSFGVVNAVLRRVGLLAGDIAWLVDADLALAAVIVPTIWKAYPLITLTLLAAMQTIPGELYEAAGVDGASAVQRFRFVTWPGIAAAAILACLVTALWVIRDIDIIFAATGGGPARATETLSLYIYAEAFQYFRIGAAAAAGAMLLASVMILAGGALAAADRQKL